LPSGVLTAILKKVAANVEDVIKHEGGNRELLLAAAYLHDIGDVEFERTDANRHEFENDLATNLLLKYGYSSHEAVKILNEIIAPHSCHTSIPMTLDGKIFATADAMAHFTSELYFYICWYHFKKKSFEKFKSWMNEKLERDYHRKIQFPYWRKKMKPYYVALKAMLNDKNCLIK
jgi:HD superfamily phosphodiesterase